MKLVDFSTRRPVAVFIFAVAAVVFGIVAFRELATDLLPDVTYPSLTIRTSFPGAAPIEVESLVSRPVENAVGVVNNLVRVSSSSRANISEVTLEFAWGTEMDFAALDVRERLDVIILPEEVDPPVLLRYDPSLDPILRIALTGDRDLIHLRRVAEERVKRLLERIEGVAAAVVQGGLEEEIQVEVDERRMANLGLSLTTLESRLAQENVNITGGRLKDGQTEYLVRTVNEILRPGDLEELVVLREGSANIRLRDVATVRRGHREREIITRLDGAESVEIAIFKAGGTNTVKVSDAAQSSLDEIRQQLAKVDPNLRVQMITDQARYIRQSVKEVLSTAAQGGVLAILVLFLFLRSWKPTLIIAAAIPISVVATFFLMYLTDISLNIMSLGGLTLGIGLLVDNAIVVLEAIQRRRDRGLNDVEAARVGASAVATAIIASTMTSICVFLPIVFVEGVAAQFFSDQALTVTFSLLVSLVVALTIIPMLASRRFTTGTIQETPSEQTTGEGTEENTAETSSAAANAVRSAAFNSSVGLFRIFKFLGKLVSIPINLLLAVPARLFTAGFQRLAALYGKGLDRALAHPWLVLLLAAAVFAGSLLLYPKLGQELVPELVQGEFYVDVELPPGTHLEVTQRRMAQLETIARDLPGIGTVYSLVGSSNQQGGLATENRENRGQLTITIAPPFSRAKEEQLIARLRQELSQQEGLELKFGRPSFFSFKTPIELELRGYNLDLLERLADQAAEGLRGIPGLKDVESSAEGGSPELVVRFDRDRLASLGLTIQEVASLVRSKVQGTVATDIQHQDRTIDIRLRSEESYRDSASNLASLTVFQQDRTTLPLSAVADITEEEGPAEIRRAEGERSALLTANLEGRDLASAGKEIERVMENLALPAGFDWTLGGQQREMQTSFDSMKLALFLAIFLVYLVMASQFESLLHPFVILFSVPLSLVGVLWALYLFEVRVSVVVLIGVVMLAGIVVNNAILLVDATNRHRRKGVEKLEALRRAGRQRLRPILMTTATTALGLLPMAIGFGEGSELRTPMALAVIGGLLASTALTLVVIPAAYKVMGR
ncbi:MAG: efflux RND transporter permease subunit [Deltaproteobacteria bacterium]|nr:efflux RND transporter permease subunit [Deltaproteobacteria bacterium]